MSMRDKEQDAGAILSDIFTRDTLLRKVRLFFFLFFFAIFLRFVHYIVRERRQDDSPILSEFLVGGCRRVYGIRDPADDRVIVYGSITRQKARVKKITRQIPSDLPHTLFQKSPS